VSSPAWAWVKNDWRADRSASRDRLIQLTLLQVFTTGHLARKRKAMRPSAASSKQPPHQGPWSSWGTSTTSRAAGKTTQPGTHSPGGSCRAVGRPVEGQATWEEYRNIVRACTEATRKAKVHRESSLARDVQDNKKGFFKSTKRKGRLGKLGPLLNEVGALLTEDTEKVQVLKAFFASFFTPKAGPQESQSMEAREEAWRKEDLPLVREDQVRDHLSK